jgi:cellulose synthase/poly-beta-1,6-N-acetylglucosamine synthase-like glycosyltransferase
VPTAVLDLDFQQLPPAITVPERYDRALILIRLCGQPVGQALLPVVGGRIGGAELRDALVDAAGWTLWERWLHDYLGWEKPRATNSTPPTATVAVCTRDRPEDLRRCLEALMRLPDDGQELLVVDSCPSTDETRRIVEDYGRVRYVREDRPGASAARNRALCEARHKIVAFTDDDAVPDPGWLRALVRNFNHPLVLCVTGLIMPLELETEAQEWFERYSSHGRGFRRRAFGWANHNPLHAAPVGVSANMALRRSVLEYLGPFDEALGPGTPTRAGEDYEMFSRILAAGYRIVYDPAALSWHRHRRTWKELRQTLYGYGIAVYAFWTRLLLIDGELSVPRLAWRWLRYKQLPVLARSILRRPGSTPLDLLLAELLGCAAGPWAYLSSRRGLRTKSERL